MLFAALVLAGCNGDAREDERPQRSGQDDTAQPAPPPDAGTQAGHGADPRRVAVPRDDPSPPTATIVLEAANGAPLGEASQPPGRPSQATVELHEPRLRGTAMGRDANGGVARVRDSLKELITCAAPGEPNFKRRRTRYFPPPQTERIRSNPGARLPTTQSRTLDLTLGRGPCGGTPAAAVEGELWGEAINGSGLEAVTPHLHFSWAR